MLSITRIWMMFWIAVALCVAMPFLIPPFAAFFIWRLLRFRRLAQESIREVETELRAQRVKAEYAQRQSIGRAWR